MKIIVFEKNYESNNISKDSTLYNTCDSTVYTLPDTALLKDHRPFFIPDFATNCTLRGQLVVRICRLGRSISARFAKRYYDAITVGVTFTAENLLKELQEKRLPWELAKGFDGSAVIGSFVQLDEIEEGLNTPFSIHEDDTLIQSGNGGDMMKKVDELIAEISQFYTLKQGDFIFTGCPVPPTTVTTNHNISGYIAEQKVLSFNVK